MVYNSFLARREIFTAMLRHPAARVCLSDRMKLIGKACGFMYLRLFGYPPFPTTRILARKTVAFLRQNRKKGLLLDVGCSFGVHSFEIARLGYAVVGVDISRASISLAQRIKDHLGISNVSFFRMDISSNGFSRRQFDLIVMYETLEHIKDDRRVIRELNRILKDGGLLLISVPYAEDVLEYDRPIGACKIAPDVRICIGEGGCHHRNGYDLNGLKSKLESNGFVIVDWEYLGVPKCLAQGVLAFPINYGLSIVLSHWNKRRVKLRVVARKTSISDV